MYPRERGARIELQKVAAFHRVSSSLNVKSLWGIEDKYRKALPRGSPAAQSASSHSIRLAALFVHLRETKFACGSLPALAVETETPKKLPNRLPRRAGRHPVT
jgi:hypothetical protein